MALSYTIGKMISGFILVLAICAVISATDRPERRERHVSNEGSTSNRMQDTESPIYSNPKSSTFKNNEFTSEPRRKVSHMLIGGHIRTETKTDPPVVVHKNDDDEDDDEARWDDGLILSSAGNGKEKKSSKSEDDDEKKTLSQQVKEGKYGLIQNEIYPTKPKRPGIISYLSNPEVPKDNARNLGGLDEEEIWLAENHVLVLRGGNFPDHEAEHKTRNDEQSWPPIDDYNAPKRQVKIPSKPKVPPPFPVQLSENGPVQIIGFNGTSQIEESTTSYENYPEKKKNVLSREEPVMNVFQNGTVSSQDLASQENATKKLGDDRESNSQDRKTKSGHIPPLNGVIGPFFPGLPPGTVFVVPPGNQSDYDEDDQSIYYPPPYSFYYKQDNSTPVPPGPLVPGIILPPPPDFFSGIEDKKPATKSQRAKYTKRPSSSSTTTSMPRISPTHYPSRKSSTKSYNKAVGTNREGSSTVSTTKQQSSRTTFTMKPVNKIKYKSNVGRSTSKPIHVQEITLPFAEVTTPTNRASTAKISEFNTAKPNTFVVNEAIGTNKSKNRWSPNVSSKSVPLVSYYATSTPSSVDEPIEATPASIKNIISTVRQSGTPNRASYYFYEEANDDQITRTTPNPTIYYRATTETPFYGDEEEIPQRDEPNKTYYDIQVTPTRETTRDYNVELIESVPKTSSRYQYNSASTMNSLVSSRDQGQRMLTESPPVYYESVTKRPQQSYYTTTKPRSYLREPQDGNRYDYEQEIKPKPIYQYSYEAADYLKRGRQQQQQQQRQPYYKHNDQQQDYYSQDNQRPTQTPEPFDEWQEIRGDNAQYDYEDSEPVSQHQVQPERENHHQHYTNRLPVSYPSTTVRPIIDTTPNPQHAYYTRQDEQLLDDVTKEYFTNFGKKLRGESLPNTTPIYGKTSGITERPRYQEVDSYVSNDYDNEQTTDTYKPPRVKVHYGDQTQRPYSLEGDTQVNYNTPLPEINPESEWIPGFNPKQRINVPLQNFRAQQTQQENQDYLQHKIQNQRVVPIRGYNRQRVIQQQNSSPTNFVPLGESGEDAQRDYSARPISLHGDTVVNYQNPRPPINPDAEIFDPSALRDNAPDKASYFAYRLPGDGGHFYFLTPQAISQRQDSNGGYLYPRPRGPRLSRRRRRGPGNA